MANRLSHETSPYLLQHKENPVDWYPWGELALNRAKIENKPILLSIGYSACHWCHVMEHESFENAEIAQLMNENFINIKVDREERPDLDQIYQNVAQAITRGGGWPLTVFLTPDLKPFFGGTYFPPEDRYGRPGFPRVLRALSEAFQKDHESVLENADKLTEWIKTYESVSVGQMKLPTAQDFNAIADILLARIDWKYGGLGGAPKFPNPMIFAFLWRFAHGANQEKGRQAVLLTLSRMAKGGIYDQLGGGFHRYSVDDSWSVPHFEKMLYDNGLLLKLYSEVLLTGKSEGKSCITASDRKLYSQTVKETVEYVLREMTSPDGGFYSAQDADSEGEEGKYFVWDLHDLEQVLDPEETQVFSLKYGVSESGNFEHGKTVLYSELEVSEVASQMGFTEEKTHQVLETACRKLLHVRSQRIAPGLDHKVLTAWNALMISGLVWAAQALEAEGKVYADVAERAFQAARNAFKFLKNEVVWGENRLLSTFQVPSQGQGQDKDKNKKGEDRDKGKGKGKGKGNGYLDDYAFLAMAALDLSRFTPDADEGREYLQSAVQWMQVILKHFKDPQGPIYYFTSDDHEALIQRPKNLFDQAIPSGAAVALEVMMVLVELGYHSVEFEEEVLSQLKSVFSMAEQSPFGMGELLCASLQNWVGPVTVSGPQASILCRHPHIYLKPADLSKAASAKPWDGGGAGAGVQDQILICHRKTCTSVDGNPENRLERAREVLGKRMEQK